MFDTHWGTIMVETTSTRLLKARDTKTAIGARKQRALSESLLKNVANGEYGAVEAVIERYGALVWSIARRMAPNPHDAEDAVQEVFADVWSNADRYDPDVAAESTFIGMIARRRLIDRRRKKGREPVSEALPDSDLVGTSDANLDSVDRDDDVELVRERIAKLKPEQQKMLELSIYHGWSHQEISDQLSVPLGTVKSHIRRGLIQVRDAIGKRSEA